MNNKKEHSTVFENFPFFILNKSSFIWNNSWFILHNSRLFWNSYCFSWKNCCFFQNSHCSIWNCHHLILNNFWIFELPLFWISILSQNNRSMLIQWNLILKLNIIILDIYLVYILFFLLFKKLNTIYLDIYLVYFWLWIAGKNEQYEMKMKWICIPIVTNQLPGCRFVSSLMEFCLRIEVVTTGSR